MAQVPVLLTRPTKPVIFEEEDDYSEEEEDITEESYDTDDEAMFAAPIIGGTIVPQMPVVIQQAAYVPVPPTIVPPAGQRGGIVAPRAPTVAPAPLKLNVVVQPKLGGLIAPQAPGIVVPVAQNIVAPNIAPLRGLTVAVPVVEGPTLIGGGVTKTTKAQLSPDELAELLSKMPGVGVAGVTPAPAAVPADVTEYVQQGIDETSDDFESRKRLTVSLASIPDYQLNNVTAATVASMLMKKAKLGLTYDANVESALSYLTALLQRT